MNKDRTDIVTTAVEKAMANGFDAGHPAWVLGVQLPHNTIFDHGFAKALWGEEEIDEYIGQEHPWKQLICEGDYAASGPSYIGPAWKYHLQSMVVADDPIQYLAENS